MSGASGIGPARIGAIWAQARGGVIGNAGTMPWHVPEDMAFFVKRTMGHPVIMGRRTWESIPPAYRPFKGRTNIVITRQEQLLPELEAAGALTAPDLTAAVEAARQMPGADLIWLVGGGQVYAEGLGSGVVDLAVVTQLDLDVDGDTHAPQLGDEWTLSGRTPEDGWETSRTGVRYRFEEYVRR